MCCVGFELPIKPNPQKGERLGANSGSVCYVKDKLFCEKPVLGGKTYLQKSDELPSPLHLLTNGDTTLANVVGLTAGNSEPESVHPIHSAEVNTPVYLHRVFLP